MNAAFLLLLLLAISSAATTVSGVYILAGLGWSLVVAGAFFLGAAAVLRKGMIANG